MISFGGVKNTAVQVTWAEGNTEPFTITCIFLVRTQKTLVRVQPTIFNDNRENAPLRSYGVVRSAKKRGSPLHLFVAGMKEAVYGTTVNH